MSDSITSLERQLASAESSASYWARKATDYSILAADMRRVAASLETEVGQLHNLLLPIHRLHTSSTWEGNAATRSRERLDAHEGQLDSAVRMINGIITDLETQAGANTTSATNARSSRDRYRQRARDLEGDILNEMYVYG